MNKPINYTLCLLLCFAIATCNIKQDPYLNHKLVKAEKLSASCYEYTPKFSMVSNIVGERYTFQKCLHATYDGQYTAERRGDTVVVNFTKAAGPEALYNITLDVDAYPRYNFLTIDGTTFTIIPAAN